MNLKLALVVVDKYTIGIWCMILVSMLILHMMKHILQQVRIIRIKLLTSIPYHLVSFGSTYIPCMMSRVNILRPSYNAVSGIWEQHIHCMIACFWPSRYGSEPKIKYIEIMITYFPVTLHTAWCGDVHTVLSYWQACAFACTFWEKPNTTHVWWIFDVLWCIPEIDNVLSTASYGGMFILHIILISETKNNFLRLLSTPFRS